MPTLLDVQTNMAAAIEAGPGHAIWSDYQGAIDRATLALSVHANTISHGRLMALEVTFPRVRDALGPERFNAFSHSFVEASGGAHEPLSLIGRTFPDWLARSSVPHFVIQLARFEWAWLESFNAAEAQPLMIEDLSGKDQDDILALHVVRHPSVRVVAHQGAQLIVRPAFEVFSLPISRVQASLLAIAAIRTQVGALIGQTLLLHPDADLLAEIGPLIEAGAFSIEDEN